jgi:HK97 family phage portal protein
VSITTIVSGWLRGTVGTGLAKLDGTLADVAHNKRIGWGDGSTYAKKNVTPETTMGLSAAWACTRLNARTIGSLPLKLYRRTGTLQRASAENHPLARVIGATPNADQTAMEFWEGMVLALCLRGNAYARIARRGDGQVVALWPISPDAVQVYRSTAGERRYRVWNGRSTDDLGGADVFHLRGFGAGGDQGLSPITYGRQTLGTAMAMEEVAGTTFANGLQVAGFVEMLAGTKVTDEQRKELVDLFAKFAGSSQAGKVMPLDPGMKFSPLNMSPADAELLASRAFAIEEICRWFGVMPILIGHAADGQTMFGSGVEQIMLAWRTLGLGPELTRIEQAIGKQLLVADQPNFYAEFIDEGLLRGDLASRAAFYASALQNGYVNRNVVAAKENFPPPPGGELYTVQSNLVPLDKLGELGGQDAPNNPGSVPQPKQLPEPQKGSQQ